MKASDFDWDSLQRKAGDLWKEIGKVADKHFWARFDAEHLPENVQQKVLALPQPAQIDFYDKYSEHTKKLKNRRNMTAIAGTFFLVTGAFPLSIIALGYLWYLKENSLPDTANDVLVKTLGRYRLASGQDFNFPPLQNPQKNPSHSPNPQMRQNPFLKDEDFDPTRLTLENLKMGYLLDYDFKTWEVIGHYIYEWQGYSAEKVFKISTLQEIAFLFMNKEFGDLSVKILQPINIHLIDERLEAEILAKQQPYNILTYEHTPYYRETAKEGFVSELKQRNAAGSRNRILVWEYYDGQRRNLIRIEQHGRLDFRCFLGQSIEATEFSDILPR